MLPDEVNMVKGCMVRTGSERILIDIRAHAAPRALRAFRLRVVLRRAQTQAHLRLIMNKHQVFHLRRCNLQLPKKIKEC